MVALRRSVTPETASLNIKLFFRIRQTSKLRAMVMSLHKIQLSQWIVINRS